MTTRYVPVHVLKTEATPSRGALHTLLLYVKGLLPLKAVTVHELTYDALCRFSDNGAVLRCDGVQY